MERRLLLVLSILIYWNSYAQSPGGVSTNLRWWLKANAGTFTGAGTGATVDGSLVQQWNDQSGVGNHATQTTNANKATYKTNIINGNPVLRFSTDQFLDATSAAGVAGTDNLQMFLVFKQNSYVAGGTGDGNGTFIIDRPTGTNNLMSFKIVNTDKYFYQKRNDSNGSLTGPVSVTSATIGPFILTEFYRTFNVGYGIYLNGRLDATSGGDNESVTAPIVRVGRHATTTNGGIDGDIAEIILYKSNPTLAERRKIESYLAIKYGITLDQTVTTDYTSSTGGVIFPATTSHSSYNNNIAGIGRDNGSGLVQTASQSQNAQSIVKIFNPNDMTNGEFFVWGNDAPSIWNSTDVPSGYTNRISRVWRAAETGEVGTFSISFDLSGLGVDMTDASKFALLIDDNGGFDDAVAHITGRSISGNVVTFTGANVNDGEYFSLASPPIPGPGGVAITSVWLRADENVYVDAGTTLATNGQTVRQWNTRNGITAANASQATSANRPTFQTNQANGNPVVRFAATNFLDFGTLGITTTSDISMTLVFKPTVTTGGTLTDETGRYIFDRTSNTSPRLSLKLLSTGKVGFQARIDGGTNTGATTTTSFVTSNLQIIDFYRRYGVRYGIYYNGANEGNVSESGGALTFPTPRLGAYQDGTSGLTGDIAEYILYNRDLTAAERNRIDSYLAIKYGLSLLQTSLTNYTASDGVVVYPTATHASYLINVAGIARDAVSRLNQASSTSVNTNAMLTVSNPSSLDELDYFVWGNNNGSLTSPNSVDVDGVDIKRRLSRVWKVAERGDVGTTTFAFDLSPIPGAKTQADLRMLVDGNNNGFADNDVTPISGTLAGSIFTVTGVNLKHGDFFTIGTTNITSTPLPIQIVSFDVAVQNNGVMASWVTSKEINNDYFSLERSFDGEEFEEAQRIPGAGTSNETLYYQSLDNPRVSGDVYYRLRQTDFDGSTWTSIVRKVSLKKTPFFVNIFPNPVDHGELNIELPADDYASHVEIFNVSGQAVFTGITRESISTVNVSGLPKGIYFVRILANSGASSQKLVIR